MTKEDLMKWRARAPGAIATIAILPIAFEFGLFSFGEKLILNFLLPAFGVTFAFIYDFVGYRKILWQEEMHRHINPLILQRIETLFPSDLHITPGELEFIRRNELKNRLSGLFWDVINSDPGLKETKSWFFENGKYYSTAFDLFVVFWVIGFMYVGLMNFVQSLLLGATALVLLSACLFSWYCLIPHYRKKHQELCEEQMRMVAARSSVVVGNAVREIVARLRANGRQMGA